MIIGYKAKYYTETGKVFLGKLIGDSPLIQRLTPQQVDQALDRVCESYSSAQVTDAEQEVLELRIRILTSAKHTRPLTLSEVGRIIGLTKERARQIQNRALEKMKQVIEEPIVELLESYR